MTYNKYTTLELWYSRVRLDHVQKLLTILARRERRRISIHEDIYAATQCVVAFTNIGREAFPIRTIRLV